MEKLINNMKNKGVFILVSMILLFSLTFVTAQPPFQQTTTSGILIESPVIEYHQINTDLEIHAHAHNLTTGLLLTNSTTYCIIHIYDSKSGTHLIEENMTFDTNGIDFMYNVNGGNFSNFGQYSVLIYCESPGSIGGFFEYALMINKNGIEPVTNEALIYIVLALGVLILFALSFYFMIATPYSNEINDKGAVIKITKLKYVKLGLILLTWVLFTWFLNILIGLSDNFVSLTMYYGFFGFIFDVMNRLALPLGVIVFVISIFEIIRDANIMGNIKKFGSAYK